jgi:histidinol-phosphate aminotransferase
MSRFQSEKLSRLTPYTPGEQPRDMQYIKLNTNESPFPPSSKAIEEAARAAKGLQLYSDPTCCALCEKLAERFGVSPDEVIVTNGSDEVLDFAFQAFCDERTPAVFPDVTYGFYPVFAARNGIDYRTIALKDDLSVDVTDYFEAEGTVVLANPNAPTGIALSRAQIEQILLHNPDRVVVVDEAYVDFGGESCVPLVHKYDNLLVTGTFSKSRSLAGGRLGFGIASKALIADLQTVRYSTNPYNVNSMTLAAGLGVLEDEEYTRSNCQTIIENREWTAQELKKRGFALTDSRANFVFAKHPALGGEALYTGLKERGVLVRHFAAPRTKDYIRVTIGSREQMQAFVSALDGVIASK